jgi:hypothetical protein
LSAPEFCSSLGRTELSDYGVGEKLRDAERSDYGVGEKLRDAQLSNYGVREKLRDAELSELRTEARRCAPDNVTAVVAGDSESCRVPPPSTTV